jgi:hypothetical protein
LTAEVLGGLVLIAAIAQGVKGNAESAAIAGGLGGLSVIFSFMPFFWDDSTPKTIKRATPITFTEKDRHPTLTMRNDTGVPIRITAPVDQGVNNSLNAYWSLPELNHNRNITVNYAISDFTFTKEVTLNADLTLPLTERPPSVTVTNNTGHPVTVSSPFSSNIANRGTFVHSKQSRTANPLHTVTYRIGDFDYNEQVTINDADVTLSLTKRPPTLTVVNNTGYAVTVSSPFSSNIANGEKYAYLKQSANPSHTVSYRIGDIQYDEQVTINNTDVTLSLTKRPPTLTVINNTGYPVNVSSPFSSNMAKGEKYAYQKQSNNPFTVNYTVVGAQYNADYSEQVTINNTDVTLTLTKGPPMVTIANNTGSTVNLCFLRNPGASWAEPNLLTLRFRPDGTRDTTEAAVQAGERRGSITNREDFRFWFGNFDVKPERCDIRIDDVQGNSYVKSNVQITRDMTLTFTQSDKR